MVLGLKCGSVYQYNGLLRAETFPTNIFTTTTAVKTNTFAVYCYKNGKQL